MEKSISINLKLKRLILPIALVSFIIFGVSLFSTKDSFAVYINGTNAKVLDIASKISAGSISDNGEMKGALLDFYVQDDSIKEIRFSCKNQYIDFTDWTRKRPNFTRRKQLTVPYGEDEADYCYLVVSWNPEKLIRILTNSKDINIEDLVEGVRSEVIVMEISYLNGKKNTKAISITLNDGGEVVARLDDYVVSKDDDFILNPKEDLPSKAGTDLIEEPEDEPTKYSKDVVEEVRAIVEKYYSGPGFQGDREVISIKYSQDFDGLKYAVHEEFKDFQIIIFKAYEKWLYSDAIARHIILARENDNDDWVVINEGY